MEALRARELVLDAAAIQRLTVVALEEQLEVYHQVHKHDHQPLL